MGVNRFLGGCGFERYWTVGMGFSAGAGFVLDGASRPGSAGPIWAVELD